MFRVDVKTSTIPGAGVGAFLTYVGAKLLNTTSKTFKICEELLSDSWHHEPMTMSRLSAVMPDGQTKSLFLTGENLHGNHNCVYWPKRLPSKPLSAKVDGTAIKIKIAGECLETFEELRNRPKDGIGHLGMYTEENYEDVTGIPCPPNLVFKLVGPYGPLSPNGKYTQITYAFPSRVYLTLV